MFDSSKLDAYLTGLLPSPRSFRRERRDHGGRDGLEYAFNYGFRDGAFTRPVDNDTPVRRRLDEQVDDRAVRLYPGL